MFRVPRFIRRFIRRRMRPRSEQEAWSVKDKLSVAYAIIAWNAFGFVGWQLFKGNIHWPVTYGIRSKEDEAVRPAVQFAHLLGYNRGNVDVYRVSGTSVVNKAEFEIEKTKSEEQAGGFKMKIFKKDGSLSWYNEKDAENEIQLIERNNLEDVNVENSEFLNADAEEEKQS